jgi:hypothetical protein
MPLIRIAIVQPCRCWIGEIKNPRKPASSTTPAVALIQAIAQITVSAPYFEKSIGAANASRGRCARRAVTNAIAIVPVIPSAPAMSAYVHARPDSDGARRSRRRASCVSAATRVHSHTTKKIRAIRQLQRASMESRAMSANSGSPRCSVESCQWLRPTRRQEFHGRLRADGSKSGSILNSARLNSATSQFKDIRRLNKAAPTIERFGSRSRPENDRVGPPSATP